LQEQRPPSARALALVPWLAVALGIAFLWGLRVPAAQRASDSQSWYSWDLRTYFLPKFVYGSRELLAGTLPLWNPFEGLGLPLLAAMQPAALYPPKVLAFALPDAELGLRVFLIAHFALLGGGFLWFARGRGIGPLGALAGGVAWTFGMTLLLSNYHPVRIAALAWIPLVFGLAERLAAGSRPAFLGLALAVGAMLLSGYAPLVADSALLLGAVAAASWACGRWSLPPQRAWPLLGAAFLAGGLLAAVQLLPLRELVAASQRDDLASRHLSVFADLFTTATLLGMALGVPALAGLGLAGLRRRACLPPLAGCALALLMLLGGWKLLRLLPGLGGIRHPLGWTLVAQFPLAWWVAVGADALADPRDTRERRLGSAVLAAVGSLWAMLCVARVFAPSLWPEPSPQRWPSPDGAAGAAGAWGPAAVLGLAAALALWVAALRRGGARRVALGVAIAAAGAGQLAAYPFGVPQPAFDHPEQPGLTRNLELPPELLAGRVASLPDVLFGFSARDRIENLFAVEASLALPRFARLTQRLGVELGSGSVDWALLAGSPGLLDAFDVSALVVPALLRPGLRGPQLRDTGIRQGRYAVLANDERPGRAWVVYGARQVDGAQAALERILSPGFDPRREAVLERPPRGAYPQRAGVPHTPAVVRYPDSSSVEIEVATARPGILVLADACAPGWTARVDGEPTPWFCADYYARGLELDPGHHVVRFAYRTPALRWGLALSAAAALALAAWGVALAWRGAPR
jgi:hypothetical protein